MALGGLIQPFADAFKLLSKQAFKPWATNFFIYLGSPVRALILALSSWSLTPLTNSNIQWEFSLFWLLVFIGLSLYPLLIAGWRSNNQYGLLGAMRGVAQTISYEIRLAITLLGILVLIKSLNFIRRFYIWSWLNLSLALPLILLWIIRAIAERNRTPFDFAEGESELVSGFNIEYGAYGFTLIFLAEYASILFLSLFTGLLRLNLRNLNFSRIRAILAFRYLWVWLRATLPRHRYDLLIDLAWKRMLPLRLSLVTFFSSI